jgi:replication factor C subunit 3/5
LTTQKFNDGFNSILNLKLQKSLSVDDIVREVHSQVMQTNMTDEMKMFVVNRLAEIEYRLAQGSNERVQIASVVGAFIEIRSIRA